MAILSRSIELHRRDSAPGRRDYPPCTRRCTAPSRNEGQSPTLSITQKTTCSLGEATRRHQTNVYIGKEEEIPMEKKTTCHCGTQETFLAFFRISPTVKHRLCLFLSCAAEQQMGTHERPSEPYKLKGWLTTVCGLCVTFLLPVLTLERALSVIATGRTGSGLISNWRNLYTHTRYRSI